MLFRSLFKPLLIAGAKTQTRRTWSRALVRPGQVHGCYTVPPFAGGKPFAFVRIDRVWRQWTEAVSVEEVRAEGFSSREQFMRALRAGRGRRLRRLFAVEFTVLWCALPGRAVDRVALRAALSTPAAAVPRAGVVAFGSAGRQRRVGRRGWFRRKK